MSQPIETVHAHFSSVLEDFDIDGLGIVDVSFDFVTATYMLTFSYHDKMFPVRLIEEKVEALLKGDKFAFRRLKNLLRDRCGVDHD